MFPAQVLCFRAMPHARVGQNKNVVTQQMAHVA